MHPRLICCLRSHCSTYMYAKKTVFATSSKSHVYKGHIFLQYYVPLNMITFLFLIADGGNWKDMACGIRQTFVCKKDYDNIAPITHEPTTPTPGGCPTDWLKLDNSCYHLEGGNDQNVWTDWQTARSRCSGLVSGSTLATIHSQLAQCKYIQFNVMR